MKKKRIIHAVSDQDNVKPWCILADMADTAHVLFRINQGTKKAFVGMNRLYTVG